jgi:hypothetical protein
MQRDERVKDLVKNLQAVGLVAGFASGLTKVPPPYVPISNLELITRRLP